jgi:hypothetical protein
LPPIFAIGLSSRSVSTWLDPTSLRLGGGRLGISGTVDAAFGSFGLPESAGADGVELSAQVGPDLATILETAAEDAAPFLEDLFGRIAVGGQEMARSESISRRP